jgi:hypothetical protein
MAQAAVQSGMDTVSMIAPAALSALTASLKAARTSGVAPLGSSASSMTANRWPSTPRSSAAA